MYWIQETWGKIGKEKTEQGLLVAGTLKLSVMAYSVVQTSMASGGQCLGLASQKDSHRRLGCTRVDEEMPWGQVTAQGTQPWQMARGYTSFVASMLTSHYWVSIRVSRG